MSPSLCCPFLGSLKTLGMSIQAYLDNIKAKTGKSPQNFKGLSDGKGFNQKGKIKPRVKAGEIVKWLKEDFDLGNGHAMSVYAVFKGRDKEKDT
ncbi:MAG: DUF4287 domain-containing protein [Flavisolibacter sp.]